MAKKATRRAPAARQERSTESSGSEQQYNPFLKAENVPQATTFQMTGWTRRLRGKFGPQIVVELEDNDGQRYDFAIGVGSPNHRILFDKFGNDETQWGTGNIVLKAKRGRTAAFVAIVKVGNAGANTADRGRPDTDDDIPF